MIVKVGRREGEDEIRRYKGEKNRVQRREARSEDPRGCREDRRVGLPSSCLA